MNQSLSPRQRGAESAQPRIRAVTEIDAASDDDRRENASVQLKLIGGFELSCQGSIVPLPMTSQRVLAFLSMQDRGSPRMHIAGSLWMDATEKRASANLRSALWKLRRPGLSLVESKGQHLRLAPQVKVDFQDVVSLARRLIDGDDCSNGELDDRALSGDLLPGWYEDWVLVERERLRQLRLHALEALSERLTAAGRYGQAVEAALAAVRGEPMRESAHRALIRVYLAEGNIGEALRQYRLYQELVQDELGLQPSAAIRRLIQR